MGKKAAQPDNPYPQTKVAREDWLRIALKTLMTDGVEAVKVLDLARRLGVSRSSFYWYFDSRQDLLDHLLQHWAETNTKAIIDHTAMPAATIMEGIINIATCWLNRRLFDPRLDFAIREWARRSKAVHKIVQQADDVRVAAIQQMFLRHDYATRDAFTRARVLYFMQIGYYALDIKEDLEERIAPTAEYLRAFTGREPEPGMVNRFIRELRQRVR
jgi:AcrR family transcriptional regulator